MRRRILHRAVVLAGVTLAGASGACALVLGIDDIPAVAGFDAGVDARADGGVDVGRHADARSDHGEDAKHARDAKSDHAEDAKPDHARDAKRGPRDAAHDHESDAQPDHARDTAPDRAVDAPADAAADVANIGVIPTATGSQTPSTATVNLAFHVLWMGETDKNTMFTPDTRAWETFGYDIDGKITTAASTDVCTLAPGASSDVQIDGDDGIDNSFGANLVGYLSAAFISGSTTGFSDYLTGRIEHGDYTFLADTVGLTKSPTQTNRGLTMGFYGASKISGTPTFTLADNWPVNAATLADGVTLASGAKTSLSDSYVVNGTFVSGDPADFIFTISVEGQPFALIIHQAVLTFQHTIDDSGASHAVNGTIAGVLRPTELNAGIETLTGSIQNGMFCGLVGFFTTAVTESQDILLDGTNTAGMPCDAISIGLGFDADEIAPPSTVEPATDGGAAGSSCGSGT